MTSTDFDARAWLNNQNRFILGFAQGDNCADCNNTCPCTTPSNSPDGFRASLSFTTLLFDEHKDGIFQEVPVSRNSHPESNPLPGDGLPCMHFCACWWQEHKHGPQRALLRIYSSICIALCAMPACSDSSNFPELSLLMSPPSLAETSHIPLSF